MLQQARLNLSMVSSFPVFLISDGIVYLLKFGGALLRDKAIKHNKIIFQEAREITKRIWRSNWTIFGVVRI